MLLFIKLLSSFSLDDNSTSQRQRSTRSCAQVQVQVQHVAGTAAGTTGAASAAMPIDSTCVVGDLEPSSIIRVLVLFLQYQLIVASLTIPWPAVLQAPLQALGVLGAPMSPETMAPDCILNRSSNSEVPLAIQRVLFFLLVPLAMLCILLIIDVLAVVVRSRHTHRSRARITLASRLLVSSMVLVFLYLPSISHTVLSLFACIQLDNPTSIPYAAAAVGSFWVLDTNQQCFEGYHAAWALALGIPGVLIFCMAIPLRIVLFTLENRHRATLFAANRAANFLCKNYTKRCCFYEGANVSFTIMLVAVSVFGVTFGAFYQGLVMNAVLAVNASLLAVVKPYANPLAGRIMTQGMACVWLTSYVALSFLPFGDVQLSSVYSYSMAMGTILLVVNAAFVVYLLWRLFKAVQQQEGIKRLVMWVKVKLGCASTPAVKHNPIAESADQPMDAMVCAATPSTSRRIASASSSGNN